MKGICLQPWEEIVGTLKKIRVENNQTTAVIRCAKQLNLAISYLNGTMEAEILQTLDNLLGKKSCDSPHRHVRETNLSKGCLTIRPRFFGFWLKNA